MNNRLKKVSVRELVPGMILGREIVIDGIKLLNKDIILNSKYIEKIKKIDSSLKILVYDEYNENHQIQDFIKESADKLNEKERVFGNVSKSLEKVFVDFNKNSKINVKELRKIQNTILEQSIDYGTIMRSIINGRKINEYFYRHSINVAVLSYMLGKWMKFSDKDLKLLIYSGLLHDIGKMKIDSKILDKPSKLTYKEFESIKKHPVIGYEIVKKIPYINEAVSMGVLMHHERCDGSGYPLKLKSGKIHNFGKIVAIADEFDAMTSNKVYRKKQCPLKVLKIMQEEALEKLDFNYWTSFLKGMVDCYIGENVKLNTGGIGKIISIDPQNLEKPLLLVEEDFVDLKEHKDIFIEDIL